MRFIKIITVALLLSLSAFSTASDKGLGHKYQEIEDIRYNNYFNFVYSYFGVEGLKASLYFLDTSDSLINEIDSINDNKEEIFIDQFLPDAHNQNTNGAMKIVYFYSTRIAFLFGVFIVITLLIHSINIFTGSSIGGNFFKGLIGYVPKAVLGAIALFPIGNVPFVIFVVLSPLGLATSYVDSSVEKIYLSRANVMPISTLPAPSAKYEVGLSMFNFAYCVNISDSKREDKKISFEMFDTGSGYKGSAQYYDCKLNVSISKDQKMIDNGILYGIENPEQYQFNAIKTALENGLETAFKGADAYARSYNKIFNEVYEEGGYSDLEKKGVIQKFESCEFSTANDEKELSLLVSNVAYCSSKELVSYLSYTSQYNENTIFGDNIFGKLEVCSAPSNGVFKSRTKISETQTNEVELLNYENRNESINQCVQQVCSLSSEYSNLYHCSLALDVKDNLDKTREKLKGGFLTSAFLLTKGAGEFTPSKSATAPLNSLSVDFDRVNKANVDYKLASESENTIDVEITKSNEIITENEWETLFNVMDGIKNEAITLKNDVNALFSDSGEVGGNTFIDKFFFCIKNPMVISGDMVCGNAYDEFNTMFNKLWRFRVEYASYYFTQKGLSKFDRREITNDKGVKTVVDNTVMKIMRRVAGFGVAYLVSNETSSANNIFTSQDSGLDTVKFAIYPVISELHHNSNVKKYIGYLIGLYDLLLIMFASIVLLTYFLFYVIIIKYLMTYVSTIWTTILGLALVVLPKNNYTVGVIKNIVNGVISLILRTIFLPLLLLMPVFVFEQFVPVLSNIFDYRDLFALNNLTTSTGIIDAIMGMISYLAIVLATMLFAFNYSEKLVDRVEDFVDNVNFTGEGKERTVALQKHKSALHRSGLKLAL